MAVNSSIKLAPDRISKLKYDTLAIQYIPKIPNSDEEEPADYYSTGGGGHAEGTEKESISTRNCDDRALGITISQEQ